MKVQFLSKLTLMKISANRAIVSANTITLLLAAYKQLRPLLLEFSDSSIDLSRPGF